MNIEVPVLGSPENSALLPRPRVYSPVTKIITDSKRRGKFLETRRGGERGVIS